MLGSAEQAVRARRVAHARDFALDARAGELSDARELGAKHRQVQEGEEREQARVSGGAVGSRFAERVGSEGGLEHHGEHGRKHRRERPGETRSDQGDGVDERIEWAVEPARCRENDGVCPDEQVQEELEIETPELALRGRAHGASCRAGRRANRRNPRERRAGRAREPCRPSGPRGTRRIRRRTPSRKHAQPLAAGRAGLEPGDPSVYPRTKRARTRPSFTDIVRKVCFRRFRGSRSPGRGLSSRSRLTVNETIWSSGRPVRS